MVPKKWRRVAVSLSNTLRDGLAHSFFDYDQIKATDSAGVDCVSFPRRLLLVAAKCGERAWL